MGRGSRSRARHITTLPSGHSFSCLTIFFFGWRSALLGAGGLKARTRYFCNATCLGSLGALKKLHTHQTPKFQPPHTPPPRHVTGLTVTNTRYPYVSFSPCRAFVASDCFAFPNPQAVRIPGTRDTSTVLIRWQGIDSQ
jgi:hypothetical protein